MGFEIASSFVAAGDTTWTLTGLAADDWIVGITGPDTTDLGGRLSPSDTGLLGSWTMLTRVDLGQALPSLHVWAAKVMTGGDTQVTFPGSGLGGQLHSMIFSISGLRDGAAEQVFQVGAASSTDPSASQDVPLYAPEDSGYLIGAWLSDGVVDYTLPGSLTAGTEQDGDTATSRYGTGTLAVQGVGTLTATASAAEAWLAVSVVARTATGTVTFPGEPLAVRAELALGAAPDADPGTWAALWTDITSDVYARQPIAISRGRGDEASTVQPSTMSLELNNSSGRYTRLNPNSPYYGLLSKNTPIRLWVDPGTGWDLRYTGFVSEWPPRQQGGNVDQAMPIQASGIMRRLNQGTVLHSALYRWATTRPWTAFWPLETDTASGLVGGHTMTIAGTVSFGAGGPAGASGAMSTADDGKTYAPVTGMADNGGWLVSWWVEVPDGFDSATQQGVLVDWQTPGMFYSRWLAYAAPGGGGAMIVGGYSDDGTVITAAGGTNLAGLGPIRITVRCIQNGGNIEVTTYLGFTVADAFVSAADTTKPISSISVNGYLGTSDPIQGSISHLVVADADPQRLQDLFVSTDNAAAGYPGETAAARVARIAAEEAVPVTIVGDDGTSQQMGVQPVDTFLDILRDCEAADGGLLYERRDGRLAYQARAGRYNEAAGFVLDYAAGHVAPPLEPTDDDQRTRNDWTVSRDGGGSARVIDQGSIDTVGRYADSASINVDADDVLTDQAAWRTHLGTVDGLRYPAIAPNLNGQAADLIPGWLALDAGQAAQITNPPADLPPGDIHLIAEGYTEAIDLVSWTASMVCSPGDPWRVGVLDDTALGRADTDGSVLAAAAGSGDTILSVATTSGPLWTANEADVPFDIAVGGEQMTVTSIGRNLNTNPYVTSDLTGWNAFHCTIARSTAQVHPLGVASILITPDGININCSANSDATGAGSITPGEDYIAVLWVYSPSGWSDLRPGIDWQDSSGVLISNEFGPLTVAPAGQWVRLAATLTAPAGASQAVVRGRQTGSPAVADIWYAWGIRLIPAGSPQQMTVTRAVNGVTKSHAAGEDVRLATPMILAL